MSGPANLPNLRPRGLKDDQGEPIRDARGKQVWGAIGAAGLEPGERAIVTRQSGSTYEVEIVETVDEFEGDPKYGDDGLLGVYRVARIGKDGNPVKSAFGSAPAGAAHAAAAGRDDTLRKAFVAFLEGTRAVITENRGNDGGLAVITDTLAMLGVGKDWTAETTKFLATAQNLSPTEAVRYFNDYIAEMADAPVAEKKRVMDAITANPAIDFNRSTKKVVLAPPTEDDEVPF